MQVILDIGNTSTKLGFFHNDKIKQHFVIEGLLSQKEFENLIKDIEVEAVIVSSVRSDSAKLEKYIDKNYHAVNLASLKLNNQKSAGKPHPYLLLPFKNRYKTPETLGRDRIANAAAVAVLYPHQNNLIIDAGTCLKFDFVDDSGRYHGGSIAPGLQMRFQSLKEYTGKLPLIKPKRFKKLIGASTEESILAGVQNGMINEVVATIANYKQNYNSINIILTGGDWRLFAEHLKKHIFAHPFLTLEGLQIILQYNLNIT